jgi:hypothetical protein
MEQGKFNSRKGDLGILLVHGSRTDINDDIIGNDFSWHGRVECGRPVGPVEQFPSLINW